MVLNNFTCLRFVASIGLFVAFAAQAGVNCSPPSIGGALQRDFPGWQVVNVKDLRQEDQSLWGEQHPHECPGWIRGDFGMGDSSSLAMTLFKRTSNGVEQVLLAARKDGSDFRLTVLSKPQPVSYLSVITRLNPGEYEDVEGNKVRIASDSVLYEAIEAGAISYYLDNGGVKSVQMSE